MDLTSIPPPKSGSVPVSPNSASLDALREVSEQLEASFLAEMLKSAGLGKTRDGLGGGGAGEDQFGSFLVQAQAEEMVKSGGIGLAEAIFESLKDRENGK